MWLLTWKILEDHPICFLWPQPKNDAVIFLEPAKESRVPNAAAPVAMIASHTTPMLESPVVSMESV
jgi:hypothetical protein